MTIDDNAENLPVDTKADTHDQPEFKLPIESDGGRLTNFAGQDDFLLAAAVKVSYGVFKFDAFTWSANWDVAVDKEMNGAGKALEKAKAKLGESPDETLAGLEPAARQQRRVGGVRDPRGGDEAHRRPSCCSGSAPPARTTRSATATSSRRSTPRTRRSRRPSPAPPRTTPSGATPST